MFLQVISEGQGNARQMLPMCGPSAGGPATTGGIGTL